MREEVGQEWHVAFCVHDEFASTKCQYFVIGVHLYIFACLFLHVFLVHPCGSSWHTRRSLLSDRSTKKTASAVMAFVQHSSHLLYIEGSMKARRDSATATKMAAASAAAASGDEVHDGVHGTDGEEGDDNDDDDDEDSGLTARSVFSLPSFYRTLVTVAGHYDGGCGGAGLVVGPVAAPAARMPTSPKTASLPLAPSDTATWGGFGPSRNNSMAASVRAFKLLSILIVSLLLLPLSAFFYLSYTLIYTSPSRALPN